MAVGRSGAVITQLPHMPELLLLWDLVVKGLCGQSLVWVA